MRVVQIRYQDDFVAPVDCQRGGRLVDRILRVGAEHHARADGLAEYLEGHGGRSVGDAERVADVERDGVVAILGADCVQSGSDVGDRVVPTCAGEPSRRAAAAALPSQRIVEPIGIVMDIEKAQSLVAWGAPRRVCAIRREIYHSTIVGDCRRQRAIGFADSAEGGFEGYHDLSPTTH